MLPLPRTVWSTTHGAPGVMAPRVVSRMASLMWSALLVAACGGDRGTPPVADPPGSSLRSGVDRPDEVPGSQIHVMYVLPSDGTDRALDTTGVLAATVGSFQQWLATQTGGRRLRLDTYRGQPDITYVRLARTNAQLTNAGAFVRDSIERDLAARGFASGHKVYAVYYDGGSTHACGGGAWPPVLPGRVAAMYLRGTPSGARPCDENPFATSPAAPAGYLELAMLHELLHTIGVVSASAPHHTLSGHVSTDPADLMYAGPLPWRPAVLDANRRNYFNPDGLATGVVNLARSAYLLPASP